VAIGDTYQTDTAGAVAAGIDALHVTGEAHVRHPAARTDRLALDSEVLVDKEARQCPN
jgi:ribonucleotide monophosphatase NagD (HAD superfamily)